MRVTSLLALWVGKLAIWLSHRLGWGGSNLPGRMARAVDGSVLRWLARGLSGASLTITGTNGKTTTANLLSGMLAAGHCRVVHNRAGANLIGGITSAYLAAAGLLGSIRANAAVMEVDEATMPRAADEIQPAVTVVTNFFRDQLDRYGELETTVGLVRQGIDRMAPAGWLVLNADDPFCVSLAGGAPMPAVAAAAELVAEPAVAADVPAPASATTAVDVAPDTPAQHRLLFFGIEDDSVATGRVGEAADAKYCIRCGQPYRYETLFYAHLGKFACPGCGFARPRPQVYARRIYDIDAHGSTVDLVTPTAGFTCRLPLPGLYNVYNALAAAAGGVAMGLSPEAIRTGLEQADSAFGRMERIPVQGRDVFLALVKNPAGYNAVLQTVLAGPERKNLLLALNDLYADGTDISWIWDVDFELLAAAEDQINFVHCSGLRAEEMALRLKYAGLSPARITVERNLERALDQGLEFVRPGELLYILPTYTAMLQMRALMHRRGYTRKFWEG